MDSQMIDKMCRLLDEEGLLLEDLRSAMLEHNEALRGQDPLRIGRALQHNLECVEASREARERRDAQVASLLSASGLDSSLGIELLIENSANGVTRALREKIDGVSSLSCAIRIINDRNRKLAEHGLDLLRGDFRILAELVSDTADRPGENGTSGKLLSMRA